MSGCWGPRLKVGSEMDRIHEVKWEGEERKMRLGVNGVLSNNAEIERTIGPEYRSERTSSCQVEV